MKPNAYYHALTQREDMFFNTKNTKTKTIEFSTEKLKQFIIKTCPNHIREYGKGTKEAPKPGTYWAVSIMGMVWYDPDKQCDTADEALSYLLENFHKDQHRPHKESEVEITNQKLRLEVEKLKLELLEATT